MSAYRSEMHALVAQCEALRSELAETKEGSADLAKKKAELEAKVAELAKARITEAEKGIAAKRQSLRGAVMGCALAAMLFAGVGGYLVMQTDELSPPPELTPALWFAQAKAHCNSVEASSFLRSNIPPGGAAGTPYKVACFALAGKFPEAREALNSLPRGQQQMAATVVFSIVHDVADAGDDMAAGPVMEFVLEYTPNNYMALYHAGMSAFGKKDMKRAKRRLNDFLALYSVDDHFTRTAIAALTQLEAAPGFP